MHMTRNAGGIAAMALAARPMRVAMSAALVSEKGVPVYDDLVAYLRAVLDRALVETFIDPGDATYDSIRQMDAKAKASGFMAIC